ncbi:DUF4274 domain-containing protein [Myceligenerans halotolerans]
MTTDDAVVPPDADEVDLWNLMSHYNWDDGFAVPLAVAQHPRCDRALALRLFWELDDTARIHLSDEADALRESFSTEMTHEPEEFERVVTYATTLVDRLRRGDFPDGRNEYDTGFMTVDDPAGQTEGQRKIRAIRTKRAQLEYDDTFLRPAIYPT